MFLGAYRRSSANLQIRKFRPVLSQNQRNMPRRTMLSFGNVLLVVTMLLQVSVALDNGVARTPPMGWLSWERFECNTQCDTDPDNCISEQLLMEMADVMVREGYRDAGYQYVVVDDCWLARERDQHGRLQPDPKRFPSGVKALADYMHARGMKLGIYEDVGTKTCAGFPGTLGNYEKDAQTFAEWQIDFLKFDGCNANLDQINAGYQAMGHYLNKTGRHIVYACEWPMYVQAHGGKPDYPLVARTCNLFRDLTDIYDSWGSVLGMIEYFGDDPGNFSSVAGPGAWNNPDQIVIGNFGLSHDQERVQMALFSILASPLMVSADFRHIRPEAKRILLNPGVIAINQDPLGVQGKRIKTVGHLSIWTKPVMPRGSVAVVFLYTYGFGYPIKVSIKLTDLGLTNPNGYRITEVFEHEHLGRYKPNDQFVCRVNPTGVYLVRATVL